MTDVKRVCPVNKRKSPWLPRQHGGGGGLAGRQRLGSDTHELDCEDVRARVPMPRGQSRVLTQEAASAALCAGLPCALGTAFVISYTWSRGANPELVNRGTGFLIPFSTLGCVYKFLHKDEAEE